MALKRINKVSGRSAFALLYHCSLLSRVRILYVFRPPPPHLPYRSAWRAVAAACARRWPRCPFPSWPRGLRPRDDPLFPAASPSPEPRVADHGSGRWPTDDRWLCVWSHDTTWTPRLYFTRRTRHLRRMPVLRSVYEQRPLFYHTHYNCLFLS